MGKTVKLTQETFLERLKLLSDSDQYEFLDDYKNFETKLRCKHLKCGYIYEVTPHHFFQGNRCPRCANNIKRSTEQFKKEVKEKFGERYIVEGEYKSNNYPILIYCNKCEHSFVTYPVKFLAGRECPHCCDRNNSKGRRTIVEYLNKKKIQYDSEKVFNDCIGQSNKVPLKFDFYIPSKNLIIEFDGEYHYKNKRGNNCFIRQHKNDLIKDKYCRENGFNLLRIPYWYLTKITSLLNKAFKKDKIFIPLCSEIKEEIVI